jgi:hypothetical protein
MIIGLVYGASLLSYGAFETHDRQAQSGWVVTNGIRADPKGFTACMG